MKKFVSIFSSTIILAVMWFIVSTVPAAAASACAPVQPEYVGYNVPNNLQPSQRKYEGISSSVYFDIGAVCTGASNKENETYIGIGDNTDVHFARIGWSYNSPNSCFELFYWVAGFYDSRYSYAPGCVSTGTNHTLQIKMVGSGCSRPPDCVELYADGVLKARTIDDPITDWIAPLQQTIYGRTDDPTSDVPGTYAGSFVNLPMLYQGLQVQNWSGTWSSTCGSYALFTGQNSLPSRYSKSLVTGTCGSGTNEADIWTIAGS